MDKKFIVMNLHKLYNSVIHSEISNQLQQFVQNVEWVAY